MILTNKRSICELSHESRPPKTSLLHLYSCELWPYPVVHKHLTGSLYSKYGLLIWSNASQGCQITFVSMPQLIPSQNACLKCPHNASTVHISFVFPACECSVHHPWCCWILHHQLNAIWRRFAITLKASLWAWGFSNIK